MNWKLGTLTLGLLVTLLTADLFAQPGRGRGRFGGGTPAGEGEATGAVGRFGAAPASGPSKLFMALDANGDGAISTREMEDAILAFAKLDEDKDGKVTVEEAGMGGAGQAQMVGGRGRGGRGRFGGGTSAEGAEPVAGGGGRGRGRGGFGGGGEAPAEEVGNAPPSGRGRGGLGGAPDQQEAPTPAPTPTPTPAVRPVDKGNPFED